MSECRNIQLLEPDSDVLVTSAGSSDQSVDESGSVELESGQTLVEITFETFKISSDFQTEITIENLVDDPAAAITHVVTGRTQAGFSIELTGAPPTSNYVLYWRVLARSGQATTSTSGSSSDPESGTTTLNQGGTTQTITFTTARTNATYGFSEFRVENIVDAAATQQIEWIQITTKTTTNFTIAINPPPDTANYKFWWTTR